MIGKLTLVTIWVHDQDEALDFYTKKLGMGSRGRHHRRDGQLPLADGWPHQSARCVAHPDRPGPTCNRW